MATILLIEDNPGLAKDLKDILLLCDYSVRIAQRGYEGIEIASSTPIDLILCDIELPDTEGYVVYETLSKNSGTATIPFIFMSANADHEKITEEYGLNTSHIIDKPFDVDALLAHIRGILALRT